MRSLPQWSMVGMGGWWQHLDIDPNFGNWASQWKPIPTSGIVSTNRYCSDQSRRSKSLVGMKDCLAFSGWTQTHNLNTSILSKKMFTTDENQCKFMFCQEERHINSLLILYWTVKVHLVSLTDTKAPLNEVHFCWGAFVLSFVWDIMQLLTAHFYVIFLWQNVHRMINL